ncbi:unnamed protein product [Mytilus coruscus]|uniref:Uncharacterized protein n=1 Tax=Mytilus coruscus TaxID=42192 RepID=A0A6J8D6B7_MYTCO|nr:unnamed protein product [Mytilus coruscus]
MLGQILSAKSGPKDIIVEDIIQSPAKSEGGLMDIIRQIENPEFKKKLSCIKIHRCNVSEVEECIAETLQHAPTQKDGPRYKKKDYEIAYRNIRCTCQEPSDYTFCTGQAIKFSRILADKKQQEVKTQLKPQTLESPYAIDLTEENGPSKTKKSKNRGTYNY